ncbi:MAG: hypothetical protein ABMA02_04000 [Saprospiraceae bacterium]
MPLSERLKIRLSGWLGSEKLEQTTDRQNRYRLGGSELDVHETEAHRRVGQSYQLQAEIEHYAPSGRQSLRSFLKLTGNPANDRVLLDRVSVPGSALSVEEKQEAAPFQAFWALEYGFKPNERQIVQVVAKFALRRNPHTLRSGYPAYAPFFGLDSTFQFLRQQTDLEQDKFLLTARYLFDLWRLKWQLELGTDHERGRLRSDLVVQNAAGGRWFAGDPFRNALDYRASTYFARAQATKRLGNWRLQGWLQQNLHDLRLDDPLIERQQQQFGLSESGLGTQYEFTQQSRIGLRYAYRPSLPGLSAYYAGYLFSGYQSVARALPELTSMPGHSARFFCLYENPRTFYGWNASVSVSRSENELGTQYAIPKPHGGTGGASVCAAGLGFSFLKHPPQSRHITPTGHVRKKRIRLNVILAKS